MKRTLIYIVSFQIVISFVSANSIAFDPLSTQKNVPANYYDFYSVEKNSLEKSCELPDLEKQNINIFQAINLALCQNPQTKISWYGIKKQAAEYGISKSAYLPTVDTSVSRMRSETSRDVKTFSDARQFSFEWLLFDFGKRGADKNREYFALISTAFRHNNTLQRFIYDVISAYSNLFSAKEVVKSSIRAEESYEAALEAAKEKYKLGLVALADVLKAETNYSQSTLVRQRAENAEEVNKGAFIQILNLPQGTILNLDPPSFVNKDYLLEQNILSLINKAAENRPDLKSLIAQEKSLEYDRKSAKLDRFPKLSLFGGRSYNDINRGINGFRDDIGLRVTFPFFTGFQKTYNIQQADYDYKTTIEQRKLLENQLAFDVWKAYQDFKTSKDTIETSEKLLKSAAESKKVAFGRYKVGRGSILDVLLAESDYANAEKEKISAQYNNFISEAALLLALGRLNIEELTNNTDRNASETE